MGGGKNFKNIFLPTAGCHHGDFTMGSNPLKITESTNPSGGELLHADRVCYMTGIKITFNNLFDFRLQ